MRTSDEDIVSRFLEATAHLSQDEAARQADGVTQDDVSRWRRGAWKRLTAKKRRALERFLEARRNGVAIGAREAGLPYGLPDEDLAPPNYEGLGIEIPERDRLKPGPMRMFDRFVHRLLDMGLGREDIEHWGRTVLAPIAHLNTLHKGREVSEAATEEEQTWILEHNIDAALRIIARRQRG